jgi:hypothetical protein
MPAPRRQPHQPPGLPESKTANVTEATLLQHKHAPDPPDSCGFFGNLFMIPITRWRAVVPPRPVQSHCALPTCRTGVPCASSSPRSTVISTPPAAPRSRRANCSSCSSCWPRVVRIVGPSRPGCSTTNARQRSMRCSRGSTCRPSEFQVNRDYPVVARSPDLAMSAEVVALTFNGVRRENSM